MNEEQSTNIRKRKKEVREEVEASETEEPQSKKKSLNDSLEKNENDSKDDSIPQEKEIIKEIIGEDRSFEGSTLFVDLIPSSCWFKSAESVVKAEFWPRLSRFLLERVDYTCECCQTKPTTEEDFPLMDEKKPIHLEIHERYQYNFGKQQQILKRLIVLCSNCHLVTHYGKKGVSNEDEEKKIVLNHLMKVNASIESIEQANEHLKKAYHRWELRDQVYWKQDFSLLTSNGIEINDPFYCPPAESFGGADGKQCLCCL